MKIFFWDFQDDNDIVREWLMFIVNLFVLAFTAFALFRTWRYYRQCMFEMMPLSMNLIATFMLLMLKLFQKGYQYDEIGHLTQIFTYFLFCYTFAIIYAAINKPEEKQKIQKIWNIILICLFVLLIVFSILVFTGQISKKCQKDTQQWPAIVSLIFQFLSFVPTAYYGGKILRKMMRKQQNESKQSTIGSFTGQIYIKQRRKQIILVLATYVFSLIIRLTLSLITIFLWDSLFECKKIQNVFIMTSDLVIGQIILVLIEINQLLPHIVIPFAMYVIPLRKMSKMNSITLSEQLIDNENDEDDKSSNNEQNVQNRVSSLLTSRYSQDGLSPKAITKRHSPLSGGSSSTSE